MTVLIGLGATVIGITAINYKMKIADKNIKQSFYKAEAGLEEGYALVAQTISNEYPGIENKSHKKWQDFLDFEKEKEKITQSVYDMDSGITYTYTDYTGPYYHHNGTVNKELANKKYEEIFCIHFKLRMNELASKDYKDSLITQLQDVSQYKTVDYGLKVSVVIDQFQYTNEVNLYDPIEENEFRQDLYSIHFSSTYGIYEYKKTVKGDITVNLTPLPAIEIKNWDTN